MLKRSLKSRFFDNFCKTISITPKIFISTKKEFEAIWSALWDNFSALKWEFHFGANRHWKFEVLHTVLNSTKHFHLIKKLEKMVGIYLLHEIQFVHGCKIDRCILIERQWNTKNVCERVRVSVCENKQFWSLLFWIFWN